MRRGTRDIRLIKLVKSSSISYKLVNSSKYMDVFQVVSARYSKKQVVTIIDYKGQEVCFKDPSLLIK